MQVFKLYFKILKSFKGILIMYFAIFLTVALVLSSVLSSSTEEGEAMKEEVLNIAIIDEDRETLGTALKEYFGSDNELMDIEYDEEVILDKLFWKELDYALVIPKGYEASIIDEDVEDMELQCMKVPGRFDASFFESELSLYMSKLISLLKAGYSVEDAQQQLLDIQAEKTDVELASFINENQNDKATTFIMYIPYLFITLGMFGIGIVLLVFNKEMVKARMECGATTLRERVTGLIGGILVYGLIQLAVVVAMVGIVSKGSIFTDIRFPYFLFNMFAMLLFGLSLGFFTGSVANSSDAINGMVNIMSLALCFIGGVFVPAEFFSESVLKVARFFPTYWYAMTTERVGAMKEMTPALAQEIFWQVGLIVGYALVIFAVTIVIIANKRKKIA